MVPATGGTGPALRDGTLEVIRGDWLILNLPGQPKAMAQTCTNPERLATGPTTHAGHFGGRALYIDLIGGPYIGTETP